MGYNPDQPRDENGRWTSGGGGGGSLASRAHYTLTSGAELTRKQEALVRRMQTANAKTLKNLAVRMKKVERGAAQVGMDWLAREKTLNSRQRVEKWSDFHHEVGKFQRIATKTHKRG